MHIIYIYLYRDEPSLVTHVLRSRFLVFLSPARCRSILYFILRPNLYIHHLRERHVKQCVCCTLHFSIVEWLQRCIGRYGGRSGPPMRGSAIVRLC